MSSIDEPDAVEEGQDKQSEKDSSPRPAYVYIIISLIMLGVSQLFALAGDGEKDEFIGGGLTIMQTTGFIAMLVQLVAFIPSFIYQTEKYYDLIGSLTYLTCILYSLFAGAETNENEFATRAILVTTLVCIWCTRLGGFLFYRVLKVGKDERFDHIKPHFFYFLMVWIIQGLWVYLTAFAAFVINSDQVTGSNDGDDNLKATDIVGLVIWILGFICECVADFQKLYWRGLTNKKHKFIDYGIWRYSRHPNYFGEMILWIGIFFISLAVLDGEQYIAIFSPVFVFLLIYFVSGVRMLERRSDEKFGNDAAYWEYKRNTSELIPLPYGWGGDKKAGPKDSL